MTLTAELEKIHDQVNHTINTISNGEGPFTDEEETALYNCIGRFDVFMEIVALLQEED